MSSSPLAIVILAAGIGSRMKSTLHKVLHPVGGRPMIAHLRETVDELGPARVVVVTGPGADAVVAAAAPAEAAVQDPPLGTADAVAKAKAVLGDFDGDLIVLYGDAPLVEAETLKRLLAGLRGGAKLALLGFRPDDPAQYGRLVLDGAGGLERIVEFKDASAAERAIGLCNAGILAADARSLFALLPRIDNRNAKGEYYLTDAVALAREEGFGLALAEAAVHEVQGVNTRADLAAAEAAVQRLYRRRALDAGVTLIDPESVYFSFDTDLGPDVVVEPNVVFAPGVTVGPGARIRAFSHLEGARVAASAIIGPFARLRPGAAIAEKAHVGNFVEIKNAVIEAGAKVNHLTYIGDARVGAGANIGAGTITCNYDGFGKYHTEIGAGAFIGSNTALVAPVTVGAGAIVGAGSTIARDVAAGELAVTRAEQAAVAGGAERFRARARAKAATAKAARAKGVS